MKTIVLATLLMFGPRSIQDFTLSSIDGKAVPLSAYKGKIALVVNAASQCG
jgi:glutathione peroxidase